MSKLTDDILAAAASLPEGKRQAFLEALAEEIGTATQKARERVAPGSAERENFKALLRPAVTVGANGVPLQDTNLAFALYNREFQAAIRAGKRPPDMGELLSELAQEQYAADHPEPSEGGSNGE